MLAGSCCMVLSGRCRTGCLILLATPQKTESQTWGEFLDSVFFPSPHVWDSVFLGGGKKNQTPCMSSFNCLGYYYCPLGNVYETNIVFLEIPKTLYSWKCFWNYYCPFESFRDHYCPLGHVSGNICPPGNVSGTNIVPL